MVKLASIYKINDTLVSEVIDDSTSLETKILEVLEPLGGIENFISKSDSVLIKPNFNTGDPFPASTDPEFLLAFVKMVLKYSKNVQIIESSTIRTNTRGIINNIMGDSLKQLEVPIITEADFVFENVDLKPHGAKYLKSVRLPREILDPNAKIILLPCLKTHFIAQFTGALKLAVGFMGRNQRIRMHMSFKVPEKVAELNLGFQTHLILQDARKIFVTKGPANGKVEYPQKIIAGTSRTAVDIHGVGLIQSYNADNKLKNINPLEVRMIKRALELDIN